MADETIQSAGQPAPAAPQPDNAAGSLTTQNAPNPTGQPTPQFDPNQVNQWKRHAEQYQGVRPMVDTLLQSGIKTQEELSSTLNLISKYREIDSALGSKGIDHQTLLSLFGNGNPAPQQTQQPAGGPSADDIAKIVRQEFHARDLVSEHQALVQSARQAESEAVASIAGQNASDEYRQTVNSLLKSVLDQQAELYPDGHPLADKSFKPFSAEQIRSASEQVKAMLNTLRGGTQISQADAAMLAAASGGSGRLDTGGAAQPNPTMLERSEDAQRAAAEQAMKWAMQQVTTTTPMSQLT